jgi:methyltransferase (TIGR00027 family)
MPVDPLRASATALASSFMRAVHLRCDQQSIIEDPYGDRLVTPAERHFLLERLLLTLPDEARVAIAADADRDRALDAAVRATPAYGHVLVRARYTEDLLRAAIDHGTEQYVVLGAGMDTFALRRPDLRERVTVFEVDHPATQALKRDRLAQAAVSLPSNVRLVCMDLEQDSLETALKGAGFEQGRRAFFGCLGVMGYLTRDGARGLLAAAGRCAAPGSEIVVDYLDRAAFAPERTSAETARMIAERTATEEPLLTGFDPGELEALLLEAGFAIIEDLGADQAARRFLTGRPDEIKLPAHVHIARAIRRDGGDS